MRPFAPKPTATLRSSSTLSSSTIITTSRSRPFSTSPALSAKTIKPHLLPSDLIPPYPYGPRLVYKQSNNGLYGTTRIQFGNSIAPKHNRKSQRFWRPNVLTHSFYCPALGAAVKTRLTSRVLKTIAREGGLQEYLLKSKAARIKELGPGGWNLRWLLMQTRAVQESFNKERRALGLDVKEVQDNDDVIAYALDRATPGPLSLKSKETLAKLRAAGIEADATFQIGADLMMEEEAEEPIPEDEGPIIVKKGKIKMIS